MHLGARNDSDQSQPRQTQRLILRNQALFRDVNERILPLPISRRAATPNLDADDEKIEHLRHDIEVLRAMLADAHDPESGAATCAPVSPVVMGIAAVLTERLERRRSLEAKRARAQRDADPYLQRPHATSTPASPRSSPSSST